MDKYGSANSTLIINGIEIENFGDTDPPINISDEEDRATLKRGIGGRTLRLDNRTRPKRVTVNILPGSPESRQLIAVAKSGADFSAYFKQAGTDESETMFDGILIQRGDRGRGGKTTVSDDQFVFLFGDSEET